MLRTWFYAGTIITLRIIMIISAQIISSAGGFYQAWPCAKISFLYEDDSAGFQNAYPQCFMTNGTIHGWIAVKAKFADNSPQIATSLGLTFGSAGWLGLVLHIMGVEIYLQMTPRESNRLRVVSYQRQLEAGFSHPGGSGLTDRLGDS